MKKGTFYPFFLPWKDASGKNIPNSEQADEILKKTDQLVKAGAKGAAITYSANYDQTQDFVQAYNNGKDLVSLTGINQAEVMIKMEAKLTTPTWAHLQGKLRIAPITTLNGYNHPVHPWNDTVWLGIVKTDLARIQTWLDEGWDMLGWINQQTQGKADPYAIGGGVAGPLPSIIQNEIQNTLKKYAKDYS